jgi:hypothetical protein
VIQDRAGRCLICDVNCYTYSIPPDGNVIAILFGGGLLFNQLLHQLLFLNKECPYNPILDTVCTARTTVGTLYCLLILGKTGVFLGTKGGNLIISLNSKNKGCRTTLNISSNRVGSKRQQNETKTGVRGGGMYPWKCNATVTTSRTFAWFFDV